MTDKPAPTPPEPAPPQQSSRGLRLPANCKEVAAEQAGIIGIVVRRGLLAAAEAP
jgi:hypothetical protein